MCDRSGLDAAPPPAVYFSQLIAPRPLATLVVRTAGQPLALAAPIRQLLSAGAFLGAIALLAIFIPARRARRVPPMTALRPD
jgi:ABC-type antimicrobial peptide transport system permease subunit